MNKAWLLKELKACNRREDRVVADNNARQNAASVRDGI